MPRNLLNYQRAHACWNVETVLKHLPPAYQAFYREWRVEQPKPVHYVAEPGNWKKNEKTGQIEQLENVPIPLRYPREARAGLWGGEAVIKGFQDRGRYAHRVPHWWVPGLHRSVLHSEVLDRQLEMVVTQRTLQLVHDHHGLDSYLLQSRACDISSLLGLKMKREILLQLARGTLRPDSETKRRELLQKYSDYIRPEEEVLWYGLTISEAIKQLRQSESAAGPPPPLKVRFRAELVEKLRQVQAEQRAAAESSADSGSWLSKINPFAGRPAEA